MPYIEVEKGVNLFVQDWGSGKPIVFISGWPFDHRCYEYQFNQLPKEGYRCIGIDMRGFGQSDKPWNGYTYDQFADDIHKVIQHLKLKDAIYVGHSMGGAIGVRYMARHKAEGFCGMVLAGAAAPSFTQKPGFPYGMTNEQCDQFIEQCYADRPKLLEMFGKIFFNTPISPEFLNWMQDMGMDATGQSTAMCLVELRDRDLRDDLQHIKIPTAIFHSPKDRVCYFELAEALHKGIKNSKIIKFDKGGHGAFYEEHEKFNSELMKFAKEAQK